MRTFWFMPLLPFALMAQPQKISISADWWMVLLTSGIVLIGVMQTIVFGLQARRLKETIVKMDEIARGSTKDIHASIAEAARAAVAMENISKSMAASVESVNQSVGINREIADRQKLVTELQSRAYLTIVFDRVVTQNPATALRFEPRMLIVNQGSTPAYNIRFEMFADVAPFPLRDDFTFHRSGNPSQFSGSIGPRLQRVISAVVPKLYSETEANQIAAGIGQRIIAWGIVEYEDAFQIKRSLRFGFTYYRLSENSWMCMDTKEKQRLQLAASTLR